MDDLPDLTVLLERIRAESEAVRVAEPFSQHQKRWSTFRFVRLAPAGADLADLLDVLAARPDGRAALRELLETLPWGEDRWPTVHLLELLGQSPDPEARRALARRLENQPSGPLRLYLLAAVAAFDPELTARQGLQNLNSAGEEERCQTLAFLRGLVDPGWRGALAPLLERLEVSCWDSTSRTLACELALKLRLRDVAPTLASPLDRLATGLVRAWQAVRIDHLGCGTFLLVLSLAGLAGMWLLDACLGRLPQPWSGIGVSAYFGWVLLVVCGTATTHFSGHETAADHRRGALYYWIGTLLGLGTPLTAHLAAWAATSTSATGLWEWWLWALPALFLLTATLFGTAVLAAIGLEWSYRRRLPTGLRLKGLFELMELHSVEEIQRRVEPGGHLERIGPDCYRVPARALAAPPRRRGELLQRVGLTVSVLGLTWAGYALRTQGAGLNATLGLMAGLLAIVVPSAFHPLMYPDQDLALDLAREFGELERQGVAQPERRTRLEEVAARSGGDALDVRVVLGELAEAEFRRL